jgi:hypothetical protein
MWATLENGVIGLLSLWRLEFYIGTRPSVDPYTYSMKTYLGVLMGFGGGRGSFVSSNEGNFYLHLIAAFLIGRIRIKRWKPWAGTSECQGKG